VDSTNHIYRTTGDFSSSGINVRDKYSVVQYHVWAQYDLNGYHEVSQTIDSNPLHSSPWYPVNLNEVFSPNWSAYYIVTPTNFSHVLGIDGLKWTLGGDKLWFEQTNIVKSGASALQSGAISHGQDSWIETSVRGPALFSFWWRASSESDHDLLTLTVNGILNKSVSGVTEWTRETLVLDPGTNLLKWCYSKNETVSDGMDSAWLDDFTWISDVSNMGFGLWSSLHGLSGSLTNLFSLDYNSDNIANGFDYAFGTNLIPDSCLLNIRILGNQAVVEIPKQEEGTIPYVDVRVKGSTNLYTWGLSLIPATNTIGMPPNKTWHQLPDELPNKAFFKLEAELK
jgi:hypothetical protein